jgi:serine phosphatase RsbU (regulator of sigma subunit)
MSNLNDYIAKNKKLEQELDEMTIAMSQAWDQLVPFLQDIPEATQVKQDVVPLLQAISVAAESDFVGIYLFEDDRWFTYPEYIEPTGELLDELKSITQDRVGKFELRIGGTVIGASTPIISEDRIIGILGVASADLNRIFTAVDFRILHRMAERFGSQIAVSQLAQLREREALQAREMQIANEIQQSVQPTVFPEDTNISMASFWQPAKEVGGDAWGWAQYDQQLTWFVLDVAGKGLPAALAAVALHTAVSMALRMGLNPIKALEAINQQFYDAYTRTDLMATVAILSLDMATGELEIANAGHPPILIRNNMEWLQLTATAPPIGVLTDLMAETQSVTLCENDLIICYSDGFSEIELPDNTLWGSEGLLNAIPLGATDVDKLTQNIMVASQTAGKTQDDQTLVSVIYKNC